MEHFGHEAQKIIRSLEPENVDGYTIALGHAFDQITLHGHFDTFDDALEVAETFERNSDWHIIPLWKV